MPIADSPTRPRIRRRRHLGFMLEDVSVAAVMAKSSLAAFTSRRVVVPPEFTPHQYAIFLLHVAAELEHFLMVEYLYAGHSLGGAQVPVEHRARVAQWREIALGIAKEEMGHLMTVQNLLRCLGGPLNLDREDYPWDSEFYPFPFRLEPLTRESLAKYVVAESPTPDEWTGTEADEIRKLAGEGTGGVPLQRVGKLYAVIRELLADDTCVKDSDFRASTYPFQANWDEWGRGYQGGARGNAAGGSMPGTPDVIVKPVTCRTDALEALDAVATQGEANLTADESQPSHFARFLQIFRDFPSDRSWSPSRPVPVDPIVITTFTEDAVQTWPGTPITHPDTQVWAHLFNLRYQLLLVNLLHTFEYPSHLAEISQNTPRGLLLHATFGEMYNLRALAETLVRLPLSVDEPARIAGPPFQMPYTLKLPFEPEDRWRQHVDLLQASAPLVARLLQVTPAGQHVFLVALQDADSRTIRMIEAIAGLPVHARR